MARIITLTVLVTLIVILGITFFQVVAPFLLPLFLAAVVAIIAQPLYRHLVRRTGNRPRVAAGLTTFCVLLSVLVPLLVGTFIAAVQLVTLAQQSGERWRGHIQEIRKDLQIDRIASRLLPYIYGVEPLPPESETEPPPDPAAAESEELTEAESAELTESEELTEEERKRELERQRIEAEHRNYINSLQAELEENITSGLQTLYARTMGVAGTAAPSVLAAVVSGLIGVIMFVIALYYFLADGPLLLSAAEQLIPVEVDYQRELLQRFTTVVRAVVLGTFMASIGQALVTASALAMCGFGSLFFVIFIVAMFTSIIPLAGVWVVWGPFAIYFASQGDWGKVFLLVLVGGGVAGTIDNLIKTYVLHTDAKLHPLLAFVCILGGLRAMGLWGVFVGPIVASCLHALVKIFNIELKEFSRSKFGDSVRIQVVSDSDNPSPPAGSPDQPPPDDPNSPTETKQSRKFKIASRRKK